MKNNQTKNNSMIKTIGCATALVLAGLMAGIAAPQNQGVPAIVGQGSGTGCIGTYYAMAEMTNSSGTFWLTPPAGTTNGIFKDVSGFQPPYTSATTVIRRSDLNTWCSNTTSGVSFPASSSTSYELIAYVTSKTPPPTNGQPIILQITWEH
jgi:hypothetical protein